MQIILPLKLANNLQDFDEIHYKYLVHLHGSWVKYIHRETIGEFGGGFVVRCDFVTSVPVITLRIPGKSEFIEIETKNKQWFVKKDNLNFIALKELLHSTKKITK